MTDTNSPRLENGSQLRRASSYRVASVIQKSHDLLDLVAIENNNTSKEKLGNRPSISRSCLALNEVFKSDNTSFGLKTMSNQDFCESKKHDLLLRKDSRTESGFLEAESYFQNEVSRNVPHSFDLLPPLEQRRQIRIRELVHLVERFKDGFSISVQKLRMAHSENLSSSNTNSLTPKLNILRKIETLLDKLISEVSRKKLIFLKPDVSNDSQDFYIDAIGSLFASNIEDLLEAYDKLNVSKDIEVYENQDNDNDGDAMDLLIEHFLRLQLGLKYVLYCTPRQHIDHRPLTEITDELNRLNRINFSKESKYDTGKDRSDSWPLPEKESYQNKDTKLIKDSVPKRSKFTVKRRHSCDNSTFKKLNSLTRSFGLLRSSGRRPKQEDANRLRALPSSESCTMTDHQGKYLPPAPWHSTPIEDQDLKRNGVREDRETSFDSNFPYSNEMETPPKVSLSNGTSSRKAELFNVNGCHKTNKSTSMDYGVTAGREKQAALCQAERSLPWNASFDCSKTMRGYPKLNSVGRNRNVENSISCRAKAENGVLKSSGSQSRTTKYGKSQVTPPSKRGIFDVFYSRCDEDIKDSFRCGFQLSSYNERLTKNDVSCPELSPTLIPKSAPHSPSLLENDINLCLFPDCEPAVGANRSALKTRQGLKGRQAESIDKNSDIDNLSLPINSSSPESDEDSCLDKYIGKNFSKNSSRSCKNRHENVVKSVNSASLNRDRFKRSGTDTKWRLGKEAIPDCSKCGKSTPTSVSFKSPKKVSQSLHSDLPAIEDTAKGVKVSVARARKTLRDFTSPRIRRKKERTLKDAEKSQVLPCKERQPFMNGMQNFHCSTSIDSSTIKAQWNKSEEKLKYRGEEVSVTSSIDSSDSDEMNPKQALALNGKQSVCIDANIDRHTVASNDLDKASDHSDEVDCEFDQNALENLRLSRSPSLTSNLSISSDFNSTVSRFLRSNSISLKEIKIGNSKFYCTSSDVDDNGPVLDDTKPSSEAGRRVSDHSTPGYSTSIIKDLVIEVDAEFASNKRLNNGPQKVLHNSVQCKNENPANEECETSAIRISKSEPVLKKSGTHPRLKANASFDTQKTVDKLRKSPKARFLSWGENFDSLLSDKDGVKIFGNFLKSEYSEENLLFWSACENFKSLRSTKIAKEAQRIFETFIATCSACEVNLDHQTRTKIKDSLASPNKSMFDQSQSKIRLLMALDSYPRFIKSEMYERLLKSA